MKEPHISVRKIIILTLVGTAFTIFLELSGVLNALVVASRRIY